MNQTMPVGQANWHLAEMESQRPMDALWLTSLGLFTGVAVGAVISAFRLIKGWAYELALSHTVLRDMSYLQIIIWLCCAFLAALCAGRLIKNPDIRYGGADWIGDALQSGQEKPWLKVLFPKFLGSWLVLAFGISVGSEGPCIQMGAATADGLKSFDPRQKVERRFFILGGCAAGLAAAFSAPFAGIAYVYEIMNEKISKPLFLFLLAGAVGIYVSCWLVFGLDIMLPVKLSEAPDIASLFALAPLAVFAGLVGSAYNYLLRGSIFLYSRQKFISIFWRPMLPFMATAVLMLAYPVITGEGIAFLSDLGFEKFGAGFLCLFLASKLLFTAFCYGSGIPAGMMVPVLCLGGVAGALYSGLACALGILPPGLESAGMVLGMAGAFAAAERAPATGFLLVAEMTGAFDLSPAILLSAAIASFVGRLLKTRTI